MQPRAAEVRKIAKILSDEWDDVEDLARFVIQSVFDMVDERDQYVVLMLEEKLGMFVFGMYDTEGGAKRAIGKTIVSPGPAPAKAVIRKVLKEKDD